MGILNYRSIRGTAFVQTLLRRYATLAAVAMLAACSSAPTGLTPPIAASSAMRTANVASVISALPQADAPVGCPDNMTCESVTLLAPLHAGTNGLGELLLATSGAQTDIDVTIARNLVLPVLTLDTTAACTTNCAIVATSDPNESGTQQGVVIENSLVNNGTAIKTTSHTSAFEPGTYYFYIAIVNDAASE
jgi:hypothetical protein